MNTDKCLRHCKRISVICVHLRASVAGNWFIVFTALLLAYPSQAEAEPDPVRIGVLAYRGKSQAVTRWSPTANYLSQALAGHRFEIVPLNLDEIGTAIREQRIHFTLTNPGNYVHLERTFGVSRIATLQTREKGQVRVRYGAVILTRLDHPDIQGLRDLKGKSFMAVSEQAFGGFQMAWRELRRNGINPFKDFSALRFAGFPQDQIVLAVRDGQVDAATVRAETLARMVESGRVALEDFLILNPQANAASPFPLSTRLYPEWPFATLRNTQRQLATQVTQALFAMPADHPALLASRTAGWTVPLDYSPVHALMKELQIGPYEVLRQTSLLAILKRYAYWLIGAGVVLVLLLLLNGYISRTNHRLRESERHLRSEILHRKRSQEALARYRDTLEQQVTARTEDLKTTNAGLEKSRVALGELVRITSAPELSHEQRMDHLLATGRRYFSMPVAVLTSTDGGRQAMRRVSGDASLVPNADGPLDPVCARRLIQHHGEPLDIPDLDSLREQASGRCAHPGWRSYLGVPVLVDGSMRYSLEFAGIEARSLPLSSWDHELLKVMAQWIGDELERRMVDESRQRHQSELARVSRMSVVGEMAASLAHELNQPLTGAINYSSGCLRLLREGRPDREKLITGMERAVEGASLAAEIIRSVREFVQKGDDQHTRVDLNGVIDNVVSLVAWEAQRHEVDIQLQLADVLPKVEGNRIQLEQVVLNFIRNAIDAMDAIRDRVRRLTISTGQSDDIVWLRAVDTGDGIAADALPLIFDAFYSTKEDGMGMGLSISRSIVESHQGTIRARSLDGGGAEFSFQLPAVV